MYNLTGKVCCSFPLLVFLFICVPLCCVPPNYTFSYQTYLLNKVSNNCAECGNPSINNSKGSSLATAAILDDPSLCSTAAASRNCRPSASTSTRLSTRRGLMGDARSRRIRSPHSRISSRRWSNRKCIEDAESCRHLPVDDILTHFYRKTRVFRRGWLVWCGCE